MDRRVCYGKGNLRDHSRLLCVLDAETEVAVIVKAAERTGNVDTLSLLDLIHKFTDVRRNRIHSQCVKAALKHMRPDTGLLERGGPLTDSLVRILSEEEVHLLESTSVGLDTVKTAHPDDRRSHFFELCDSRDVFSRRLPHIPIYEGELYLFLHSSTIGLR